MENKKLKSLLIALGVWFSLSVIFLGVQFYFLWANWLTIAVGVALGIFVFYLHILLYKAYSKKKTWALKTLYVYAFVNLLPLMFQLSLLKEPGFDNVIVAIIAFALVYLISPQDP